MEISKAFVLGSGIMGQGIAQVCAQAGIRVALCDLERNILDKALAGILTSVSKLAAKGIITDSPDVVISRIVTSTDYHSAGDSGLVIEAVYENVEIKKKVFKQLEKIVGPDTIFASNTSALPIGQIASVTDRPDRFLGLHFFNPVPLMDVVEVIKGVSTSEATFQFGASFVKRIGKQPLLVNRDIAGFILNRINMLSNMEAYRLVEQGVASPEDIDKGMKLAFGRKMGPMETSDMVGLDVQLMAYTNVYEEEKDPRFYPPSILRRKVEAGHLGRKSGRGWYEYNVDGTRKVNT